MSTLGTRAAGCWVQAHGACRALVTQCSATCTREGAGCRRMGRAGRWSRNALPHVPGRVLGAGACGVPGDCHAMFCHMYQGGCLAQAHGACRATGHAMFCHMCQGGCWAQAHGACRATGHAVFCHMYQIGRVLGAGAWGTPGDWSRIILPHVPDREGAWRRRMWRAWRWRRCCTPWRGTTKWPMCRPRGLSCSASWGRHGASSVALSSDTSAGRGVPALLKGTRGKAVFHALPGQHKLL